MSHFIDISGQRFGKLVAIEHVPVDDRISRASPWIYPWGLADGNCS